MKKVLLISLMLITQLTFAKTTIGNGITPIMGFEVEAEGLSFTVTSGGCTSAKDFRIDILESNPVQVELVRLRYDFCEAYIPLGVKIKFTWEEMGLENESNFFIRNPISLISKPYIY